MVEPVRHRRTKGAETDMFEPKATASHIDSTRNGLPIEQRPSLGQSGKHILAVSLYGFDPKRASGSGAVAIATIESVHLGKV